MARLSFDGAAARHPRPGDRRHERPGAGDGAGARAGGRPGGGDQPSRERAQATAAELGAGALGVELDVRDASSVSAAVDMAYGVLDGLDVLVNNVGIGMRTVNPRFMTEPQPFWEVPPAGFRNVLETKATGTFLVARAVVSRMLSAGGGRVVTISMNERTMTRRGFIPYGPSGAAVEAMARVDREAMSEHGHYSEQEFEELVSSALDELPIEFQRALEHVAIVVSDRGAENHAYGMYVGSKLGGMPFFVGGGLPDEILIFRDTLVRDFGDDRERLRLHVIQTVRHEVGHHLGFNETGVRKLGL
jgi:predicted Zn-dependent protease with MMP-like domain